MIKMNEEYIKEYENMSLYDFADELVEPFLTIKQDLTKTIYIHYAKERDKNEQLQNNWNELKKWCKENQYNDNFDSCQVDNYTTYGVILKKMEELESDD